MIIDGSTIETGEVIDADLCIVGAGPAGLALASRMIGTEHRVYLLDSGDDRVDDRSRELADGEVVGHPYFRLSEARGFAVGGSSHLWDEWMRARPLDPIDFETRPWVTDSGWPISRDDLGPYYTEAHDLLGLGEPVYSVDADVGRSLASEMAEIVPAVFRYTNTFDFEKVRRDIGVSSNVILVVNATVVELVPGDNGAHLEHVIVSSERPQRFSVASRVVTLASGGIDTPRLLLASRAWSERGVANSSGLVGSFFMEHPTVRSGVVALDRFDSFPTDFFLFKPEAGIKGALVPTDSAMARHGTLNGMMMLTPTDDVRSSEARRSIALVRDGLHGGNESGESLMRHSVNALTRPLELWRLAAAGRGYQPKPRLQVSITVEQAPNPSSRVRLSQKRDHVGLPLPSLDWRLGSLERDSVRAIQVMVDSMLRAREHGRLTRLLGEERPPRVFRGEWHQLGTTRMSGSPRQGVVNADCRTHDIDNLYIVGGSVFPTVGYANPTLTIVALALRLARQLEVVLARGVSLGPLW